MDIIGLGAPVIDHILKVGDDFLRDLPGELGGMELVNYQTLERILESSGEVPVPVPGGSASNVMVGLAHLGNACAMVGCVGDDQAGRTYAEALAEIGVIPKLGVGKTPTSRALSLISGDGHRTMRTFIGASAELSVDNLDEEAFKGIKLLHLEGYNLFNPEPAMHAIDLAKKVGARVSLDLGSFEVVRAFRDQVNQLLGGQVDILFANEDEARELTGQDPEEACETLGNRCEVATVMMAEKGSWSKRGDEKMHHPAFVVQHPADPTGAGDLFASGFLHAFLREEPLLKCMGAGSLMGAAVVQVLGAGLPHSLLPRLRNELGIELNV